MSRMHGKLVPAQAPLQLVNTKPLLGFAVRFTWLPRWTFATQVSGQVLPPGSIATEPPRVTEIVNVAVPLGDGVLPWLVPPGG